MANTGPKDRVTVRSMSDNQGLSGGGTLLELKVRLHRPTFTLLP